MVSQEERDVVRGSRIPVNSKCLLSLEKLAKMVDMTRGNIVHMIRTGRRCADGRTAKLQVIKTSGGVRSTLDAYWEFQEIISGYVKNEDSMDNPVCSWTRNWIVVEDFVLFRFRAEDLRWLIQHLEESDGLRRELVESIEELVPA